MRGDLEWRRWRCAAPQLRAIAVRPQTYAFALDAVAADPGVAAPAAAPRPGQAVGPLVILSRLMGFVSISTDLYLPAMPAIGRSLHAPPGRIALTLSGYLIGFSVGPLCAWSRRSSALAGPG